MQLIFDLNQVDESELEGFIFNHPHGSFFQSIKAFHFFQTIDNHEPVMIAAVDQEKIVGSLLAVIVKEGDGLKGYFSRRFIVWGGPLVKDDDPVVWASLLETLGEVTKGKAIYTEFRNFRDLAELQYVYKDAGFQFNEHLNYIVTIPSLEKARAGLSKSKKRQINKSIKTGAKIVQAVNLAQVEEFYDILKQLYREKVKKPLPGFDFFSRFFQDKSLGIFLLIQLDERIIGGIMCPVYKDTMYEWFVCGLDGEIKDVYPSVLATWAPIAHAAENGLTCFDFMGAGKPNQDYGVREFKSKFGGDLVNFGRFVRINQKCHYQVGKLGLEILKRVK
jgi:lipid II:glycine glycyltransferase (peptidoglycan interpeptide bridge formation enzyme)